VADCRVEQRGDATVLPKQDHIPTGMLLRQAARGSFRRHVRPVEAGDRRLARRAQGAHQRLIAVAVRRRHPSFVGQSNHDPPPGQISLIQLRQHRPGRTAARNCQDRLLLPRKSALQRIGDPISDRARTIRNRKIDRSFRPSEPPLNASERASDAPQEGAGSLARSTGAAALGTWHVRCAKHRRIGIIVRPIRISMLSCFSP
jgi:hypothetical protein